MANKSDIIKIGFDYRASLEQFKNETNGVFDGISEKAGKQKITIHLDAKNDKIIEKIKELQKLKLDSFTFEFKDSGIKEQLKTFGQLENKINEIINLSKGSSNNGIGNSFVDEKQLNTIIDLFTKMESHLGSMKKVFSDVGDGEEFSPLLKMINNVQSAISELSASVKNIGFNMNIDFGSDSEMETKVQSKISNALQAYQRLFEHIKMSSAGGQIINNKFFDFDIDQYDTMMGKLQAYRKFIENMRKEAKFYFNGEDVLYQNTDKSYWTQASSTMGQVTKAFNEMKSSADDNPLADIFGKTDLSEVISQLGLIITKLEEISTTASSFKDGFNITASVEEIEKLTSRVKELEEELSKVKTSTVVPVESNISSFQGNKIENATTSTKRLEQEAKLIKKQWDENVKAIQNYMDANIRLNNLKAQDKGTGSKSSQIEDQTKIVEELREKALEARTAISSMIDIHNVPLDTRKDYLSVMDKFEQATFGSSQSVAKLEDSLRNMNQANINKIVSDINTFKSKADDYSERTNQSAKYTEQVNKLNVAIKELRTEQSKLSATEGISKDQQKRIDDLKDSCNEYITTLSHMSAAEKGSSESSRMKQFDKIAEYMKKNTKMSKQFREELEALLKTLKNGDASVNVEEINTQFLKLKDRIREAGQEGKSFIDIFKNKAVYGFAAKLATYYLSFYDFIRYARNAFNAVRELDTALVDLKKTTTMTSSALNDFYFDSNDVAKRMGVTTKSIIEQASAWSRFNKIDPLYGDIWVNS